MHSLKTLLLKLTEKECHSEEVHKAVALVSKQLLDASRAGPDEIFRNLDTGFEGLSEEAAEKRLAKYGKNEVAHEKAPAWYNHLLQAF